MDRKFLLVFPIGMMSLIGCILLNAFGERNILQMSYFNNGDSYSNHSANINKISNNISDHFDYSQIYQYIVQHPNSSAKSFMIPSHMGAYINASLWWPWPSTPQPLKHKLLAIYNGIEKLYQLSLHKYGADNVAIFAEPHGGTSIGAIRHHGIITWDDDIDISIFIRNESFVNDILPFIHHNLTNHSIYGKYGCSPNIVQRQSFLQLFFVSGTERSRINSEKWAWNRSIVHNMPYPFLDIWIANYNEFKNKIYFKYFKMYPDRNYSEIFPIHFMPFENVYMPMANRFLNFNDKFTHEVTTICDPRSLYHRTNHRRNWRRYLFNCTELWFNGTYVRIRQYFELHQFIQLFVRDDYKRNFIQIYNGINKKKNKNKEKTIRLEVSLHGDDSIHGTYIWLNDYIIPQNVTQFVKNVEYNFVNISS